MIEIVMEVDDEFWNIIKQLTVFKEQKEIVHCKDCKYWAECTFAQPTKNYCGRLLQADYNNHDFGFEMDADDFCSQGERKKLTEF